MRARSLMEDVADIIHRSLVVQIEECGLLAGLPYDPQFTLQQSLGGIVGELSRPS
jgi:hypothetical protein